MYLFIFLSSQEKQCPTPPSLTTSVIWYVIFNNSDSLIVFYAMIFVSIIYCCKKWTKPKRVLGSLENHLSLSSDSHNIGKITWNGYSNAKIAMIHCLCLFVFCFYKTHLCNTLEYFSQFLECCGTYSTAQA